MMTKSEDIVACLREYAEALRDEYVAGIGPVPLLEAADEIERLRKPWLPFATAPQDRRDILVWRHDAGVFVARCTLSDDGETDVWFSVGDEDLTGDLPTLWMPLPEPPETGNK